MDKEFVENLLNTEILKDVPIINVIKVLLAIKYINEQGIK